MSLNRRTLFLNSIKFGQEQLPTVYLQQTVSSFGEWSLGILEQQIPILQSLKSSQKQLSDNDQENVEKLFISCCQHKVIKDQILSFFCLYFQFHTLKNASTFITFVAVQEQFSLDLMKAVYGSFLQMIQSDYDTFRNCYFPIIFQQFLQPGNPTEQQIVLLQPLYHYAMASERLQTFDLDVYMQLFPTQFWLFNETLEFKCLASELVHAIVYNSSKDTVTQDFIDVLSFANVQFSEFLTYCSQKYEYISNKHEEEYTSNFKKYVQILFFLGQTSLTLSTFDKTGLIYTYFNIDIITKVSKQLINCQGGYAYLYLCFEIFKQAAYQKQYSYLSYVYSFVCILKKQLYSAKMNHLEMALDISYQLSKLLGCIIFLTNESGVDGYIRYKCGQQELQISSERKKQIEEVIEIFIKILQLGRASNQAKTLVQDFITFLSLESKLFESLFFSQYNGAEILSEQALQSFQ